jgi:hypothetical protein
MLQEEHGRSFFRGVTHSDKAGQLLLIEESVNFTDKTTMVAEKMEVFLTFFEKFGIKFSI